MNPARRDLLRLLGALSLLPVLPACGPRAEKPLVIACHVWPGYEPIFLARQKGWLPQEGLRLLETASASESMAALADGRADGAALTLDETLRVRGQGIALTVVLVFDMSAGADMLLAKPEIAALADLAGRRVGVEDSALGALMLLEILKAAELPESAVVKIPLPIDRHLAAWRDGKLDAVVTYEPTAGAILREGGRRLFDSRQIPDTIFDVLAVKPEATCVHAGTLRGLIAGHLRALNHLLRSPQDAAYRMATRMNLSAPEVLESFRYLDLPNARANCQYLAAGEGRLVQAARNLSGVLVRSGLLPREDDLAALVSTAFLPPEAHR